MSATRIESERLERIPMSREEFDALPENVRAEYVNGIAIVTPPARHTHNRRYFNLAVALDQALPDLYVVTEAGLELTETRLRIPDIAVMPLLEDKHWSDATPVLVAEVLSRSTRSEDLLRKPIDYLRAGISQYWVLDPEHRTLTVLGADRDGSWETLLELDAEHPVGEVAVGEHGQVPLDLGALLDR